MAVIELPILQRCRQNHYGKPPQNLKNSSSESIVESPDFNVVIIPVLLFLSAVGKFQRHLPWPVFTER